MTSRHVPQPDRLSAEKEAAASLDVLQLLEQAAQMVRELVDTEDGRAPVELALNNLVEARQHLRILRLERPAATALTLIRQAGQELLKADHTQNSPYRMAVKAAERAARVLVIWRCLNQKKPQSRKQLLQALHMAFGVTKLDTDLQAQLLLSHRMIAKEVIECFASNVIEEVRQPQSARDFEDWSLVSDDERWVVVGE